MRINFGVKYYFEKIQDGGRHWLSASYYNTAVTKQKDCRVC